MADGAHTGLARTRRRAPSGAPVPPRRLRGDLLLATVAACFTLAQLLLVRPGLGLGWDEVVYVSQVARDIPTAFFSAPRARGVPLLVAPVALWSSWTPLLRVYLAVLSGGALYLALRLWRPLFPARVLAAAGALFASLWVTLFYGPQAMPNLWVALGALACVGCFLRARADRRDRVALWGVVVSAAVMALMRPMDAVWVTLPLLALACRHLRLELALLAGLAAGAAEWVIEAYVGYGGLVQRLADASRIQGDLGWHLAVLDQLRSLSGRTLCRPCTGAMPPPPVTLWWFALPLLAALGLALAVRARRTLPTLLPLACATTAAVPYLFLIGYAAPRFLLPAYALLALPVADALFRLVTAPDGRLRPVVALAVALGIAGHAAIQLAVLQHTVDQAAATRRAWGATASELHRLGVRPPCLLTGHEAIPIGYYTGCASADISGNNANTTPAAILRTARHIPVATVTERGDPTPAYARDWPTHRSGTTYLHVAPPPDRERDGVSRALGSGRTR